MLVGRMLIIGCFICCWLHAGAKNGANFGILHNKEARRITVTTQKGHLRLVIDYSRGCRISELFIHGQNTLSSAGITTGITTKQTSFNSNLLKSPPVVNVKNNQVTITDLEFGEDSVHVTESWTFDVTENNIVWNLNRKYDQSTIVEEIEFPRWSFASLSTWKGGIIDNGGMVWSKYLGAVNDTYGVHTGGTVFWNENTGHGLSVQGKTPTGLSMAMKYSHSSTGEFINTHTVSNKPLRQRYQLNRFISGKADVFDTFQTGQEISATFTISYIDYSTTYDRGHLSGLNAKAVRELMNTTARYGVVDNNIVGGNGWLTNWKCLHEPFFSQIAVALADSNYTNNLKNTLNQERDLAIQPNGRVLSRWHNEPGDEMPGTFNRETGYYETIWGYTVDSQTGYVINVAELFELSGDIQWLASHKESCENALQWLIKRDKNKNGLFEMMNNNISEKKSSDWIDIVWAGFENAFVNAQMYAALKQWANCEMLLGDTLSSRHFNNIALKLQQSFNKPVKEGGFWLPEKKQYIYWRDDDNSIHGDNLVTPVNFAAIAFGLCDDKDRIKSILEQIEKRTTEEKLFHWPLCFDSFKKEEVADNNWPFPTYENGDIFPTWGYLGVRAYVQYDKSIAIKYIINLLDQYEKDGLSSQRYDRETGKGLGTDILSGICTGVTALYTDVYGVQPRWNHLRINPKLTKELNGTSFTYPLRDTLYRISLSQNDYKVSTAFYSITSNRNFGISGGKGKLLFYSGAQDTATLSITWSNKNTPGFTIHQTDSGYQIAVNAPGLYTFSLKSGDNIIYRLQEGRSSRVPEADVDGQIIITRKMKVDRPLEIISVNK